MNHIFSQFLTINYYNLVRLHQSTIYNMRIVYSKEKGKIEF